MPNDSHSPKPIAIEDVHIESGLWGERQAANRSRTIPAIYHQMDITGRLEALNLKRERPRKRSVIQMFWDSDPAKWIEAVGYSLHTHPDPALEAQADDLIDRLEKAQQPDGYLNTYFTVLEPENRWKDLRDWHEMYNAGHLIEGAVAYYEATGKRKVLDVLCRYADLIDRLFGPNEGQRHGYPGHPELELALVKLYRATGEQRYLKLAKYFIDERGKQPHYFDLEASERGEDPRDFWAKNYRYCQAHEPLRDQQEATGHAVRACYLYTGIADVARETGDQSLVDLSRRLWDDLTQHQMYITGGLGPAHSNEGFTFAYDLPNETAYAETCASCALVFWAQRMFQIDPHGRYIDVMERALYNTVLAGVSHDGDEFFYANPLTAYPRINPTENFSGIASAEHYRRSEWFECPCCPANASRTVASIGTYFYSTTPNRVYVHLYSPNVAHFNIQDSHVHLEQQTNYPWDGSVQISLGLDKPATFDLALRVPGWCRNYSVTVNGAAQNVTPENGYIVLSRQWKTGDSVGLTLDMPVERIAPHPMIRQDVGQIALQCGPLVYCVEEVDNGAQLANVVLPKDAPLHAEFDAELFGGVSVIHGQALRVEPSNWSSEMYLPEADVEYKRTPFDLTAIPYALWANRAPGEMRVWIRES